MSSASVAVSNIPFHDDTPLPRPTQNIRNELKRRKTHEVINTYTLLVHISLKLESCCTISLQFSLLLMGRMTATLLVGKHARPLKETKGSNRWGQQEVCSLPYDRKIEDVCQAGQIKGNVLKTQQKIVTITSFALLRTVVSGNGCQLREDIRLHHNTLYEIEKFNNIAIHVPSSREKEWGGGERERGKGRDKVRQ